MTATEQLRRSIEVETTVYHWGQPCKITPRFVAAKIGDGKQLLAIYPTIYRPNHFVIRIDSAHQLGWSDENGPDKWLDDVYDAISDEYHEWPWADDYWPEEKDDEDSEHRRVDWSDGSCWSWYDLPEKKKKARKAN